MQIIWKLVGKRSRARHRQSQNFRSALSDRVKPRRNPEEKIVGQIIEELSYNEIVLFSPILASIMQKFRIAANSLSFLMCVMRILKRRISLVRNSQATELSNLRWKESLPTDWSHKKLQSKVHRLWAHMMNITFVSWNYEYLRGILLSLHDYCSFGMWSCNWRRGHSNLIFGSFSYAG